MIKLDEILFIEEHLECIKNQYSKDGRCDFAAVRHHLRAVRAILEIVEAAS